MRNESAVTRLLFRVLAMFARAFRIIDDDAFEAALQVMRDRYPVLESGPVVRLGPGHHVGRTSPDFEALISDSIVAYGDMKRIALDAKTVADRFDIVMHDLGEQATAKNVRQVYQLKFSVPVEPSVRPSRSRTKNTSRQKRPLAGAS